jgi:hypothetical protein
MRTKSALRLLPVTLALVGILVPQAAYAADGLAAPTPQTGAVQDVSLDHNGCLRGQLVDSNGTSLSATAVRLQQFGRVIGQASTDAQGNFAVSGLRAGMYELTANQTSCAIRVWTAAAAPPSATSKILVVDRRDVVRGQGANVARLLLIGGLIVTAGVIGGVIGYNIKDDDSAS